MTNLIARIIKLEKAIMPETNDLRDTVIIAYKKKGINYYKDKDGVEGRVDDIKSKNGLVILPLLNGKSDPDSDGDFVINHNEYPR